MIKKPKSNIPVFVVNGEGELTDVYLRSQGFIRTMREYAPSCYCCEEAANEIERLRGVIQQIIDTGAPSEIEAMCRAALL